MKEKKSTGHTLPFTLVCKIKNTKAWFSKIEGHHKNRVRQDLDKKMDKIPGGWMGVQSKNFQTLLWKEEIFKKKK